MTPDEPDPKRDEKQHEKEDEKRREKGVDEKYRRDPLGTISFGALIVWLGVFLLPQNLDLVREAHRG